jgi:hypothetical protein
MAEWLEKLQAKAKKDFWKILGVLFSGAGLLVVDRLVFNEPPKAPPPPAASVAMQNPAISLRDQAQLNLAGRDINIQAIMQGIDERDLRHWLEKLSAQDKAGREREVRQWYEQKFIPANLREALLLVVARIDEELRASQEVIKELRQAGQNDLAEMLERLNRAFEGGVGQLEPGKHGIINDDRRRPGDGSPPDHPNKMMGRKSPTSLEAKMSTPANAGH